MSLSINVAETINRARMSGFQIRILVICTAVLIVDGFDAQALGFAIPSLSAEWKVPPGAFTTAATVGVAGLLVGSLLVGALSDRLGRRPVTLAGLALITVTMFATAGAGSMEWLIALRFLTSAAVGALTPNLIALVSEFSPQRSRLFTATIAISGFSLGGVLGGFLAAWLVPLTGWHGVFIAGGLITLVTGLGVLFGVPESVRFLTLAGNQEAVRRLMIRITGQNVSDGTTFVLAEEKTGRASLAALFDRKRAVLTALLWLTFFMSLLVLYFGANWLPTILAGAGFTASFALIGTSIYNMAMVLGALLSGFTADKVKRPELVLGGAYAGAFVTFLCMPLVSGSPGLLLVVLCFAGFFVQAGQASLAGFAGTLYPTSIRATGLGWAFGAGRIGSIVGPLIGGVLIAASFGGVTILSMLAVPSAVASLAVTTIGLRKSGRVSETDLKLEDGHAVGKAHS
ncbi:MFS transporter [Pseudarthrobacter niigatensis]|uniref:AAHS family 4-hydroxybenzoate transporter-like MFS transporter n=1 Tax=Pseudarthrobacter niigatensis TaxID=369935 RepID=A0AAJ1SPH1_9MICC|nr:MFS transporter [Pseudarthrobacter niigatensis]MDQ0144656.1 AAHS family 4-hydroxybenzoate transporter-like MFS transporter [Pseudarthrobacter niigatensis]MDQ0265302.1 AAHS family 4-hydroxybenzoate transporter-like MFS transporter [Pseudarthrobacter niigatensis]